MEVYIDGMRLINLGMTKKNLPTHHMFLDDIVTLTSVAGIEVYPSAVNAPPKYQSLNGMCGLVLLRTK